MFKKTMLASMALTLAGCMPPCGSSTPNPYYITAKAATVAVYNSPNQPNTLVELPVEGNIDAQDFTIKLSINQKSGSTSSTQSSLAYLRFSLFKNAHACSPPDNSSGSGQQLHQLKIISDTAFNEAYPAGSSLNSLFQVESIDVANVFGMEIDDLLHSQDSGISFNSHIELRLTQPPSINQHHRIKVEINNEAPLEVAEVNFYVK